jgi:hypothetical protein
LGIAAHLHAEEVLLELAGRKLLALFGRAEARDFADYVLEQRFGKDFCCNRPKR